MIERCEVMARQKLKAKEKKTQKITKYGLIEKSQETGKQSNISNKVSDFSLDKKQWKEQNTEETKEEKQGGRTARLASFKKKQQRKRIQKAQLENEIKSDIPLYKQNFLSLENNTITDVALSNEENQQEQQYQPTKSNAQSDFKKRIAKKAITKNKKNTKLQGVAQTKTVLQNYGVNSTLHYDNEKNSDKKTEKSNDRKIKQKLYDVTVKESETAENQQFHTENNHFRISKEKKYDMKKQQHKRQQRKSAEMIRKNDFSLQQSKKEQNKNEFQSNENREQRNNLEFEHRKQEQKPQKLKLQEQRYNTQNNKEIIKENHYKKQKNSKIQFSKKEQQNEVSESNFNKNTEIPYHSLDKNTKEELQKAKKLQYYASEKQEQKNDTNETIEQKNIKNEKDISLGKETKKEISTKEIGRAHV